MAEAVALAALLWAFFPLLNYGSLPETIPSHFDFAGTADAWSRKSSLWTVPIIAAICYAGLTVLAFFPGSFNLPVQRTEKNTERLHGLAVTMIKWIKAIVTVLFAYIANASAGLIGNGSLNPWILWGLLAFMVVLLVIFATKMSRTGKNK